MENRLRNGNAGAGSGSGFGLESRFFVFFFSAVIFLGCVFSPPYLLDDVDSVQAQIARNMLDSHDWVTARLDGVAYLEKSPMNYWLIAAMYKIFGVHDWAARIPSALAAVALALLTAAFGTWAFGRRAGHAAGLVVGTCIGLFLFTRILIPDVMLTVTICLALWAFLRALDEEEQRPGLWAATMAAAIGVGMLLKGLIAAVFPIGGAVVYLLVTRQFFAARTWQRLRPVSGALIVLAIATPWMVLATLANPPYFAWTLHGGPGEYHGYLWFYLINEHVLRFLNRRYPRDYNTVPRLAFWLFHFLWLFPWSAYFPAVIKESFRPVDRGGRTRLLAVCWAGFVLVFFSLSTTQEYYSMPIYPALALLLGSAMASGSAWITRGTRVVATIVSVAAVIIGYLLWVNRGVPTPGDISTALTQHPEAYTLSLGHMGDLTLRSFAYLRLPLAVAGIALVIGAIGAWTLKGARATITLALMMAVFFHAARLAMVTFDPYLSSEPLAKAINRAPAGELIMGGQYYTFASIFFYTGRRALILNGRANNLEYGSYAPDAPPIFIGNEDLARLWAKPERYYLVAEGDKVAELEKLLDAGAMHMVAASGGKFVFTNRP